jgi:tetratricopeptide (TPR) repeat protein
MVNSRVRFFALLALASALSAAEAQQVVTTQDRALAKLQAELSKNPSSFAAIRAVGFKLFELKRYAEARPLLEQARTMKPKDGMAALYAGMAAEETKDLSAARTAYSKYLEVGTSKKTKDDIRGRIIAISREELKQTAAAAVANEQALRGQQVDGKTVAVLPFRCVCDTAYKPLERGLAELVVTDLSVSKQLRVLERDRMQAIADEIRLSTAGAVEAGTATRAGKLIQAGTIVNGSVSIAGATMSLASALVNTNSGQIMPNSPSVPDGLLSALFDAEKKFVLGVFGVLDVKLLASEQKLFDRPPPTRNLQAFLAFSRGLLAQDAGRLDEARAFFESARTSDPGFNIAVQRANQTAAAQQQATTTTTTVDQGVRNTSEGQSVTAASNGVATAATPNAVLANVVANVNPTTTNTVQNNTTQSGNTGGTGGSGGGSSGGGSAPPTTQNTVSQATGTDQPATRTGQVTIVIKRP